MFVTIINKSLHFIKNNVLLVLLILFSIKLVSAFCVHIHYVRYNPCTALKDCNSTSDTALCQTRIAGSLAGRSLRTGIQSRAIFQASSMYDIDIIYPFYDPLHGWPDDSTVHVICNKKFELNASFEVEFDNPAISNRAHFFLSTRNACPPTMPTTRTTTTAILTTRATTTTGVRTTTTIANPLSHTTSSFPFIWLVLTIIAIVVVLILICVSCMRSSLCKRQSNVFIDAPLNSARNSHFRHRTSRRDSDDYYTTGESARSSVGSVVWGRTSTASEMRSPQVMAHSRLSTVGTSAHSHLHSHSQSSAPEFASPPSYESVIRMKGLETQEAGAYTITAL